MPKSVKELRVIFGDGDGGSGLKSDREVAMERAHALIERVPTPILIAWLPVFAEHALPDKPDLHVIGALGGKESC